MCYLACGGGVVDGQTGCRLSDVRKYCNVQTRAHTRTTCVPAAKGCDLCALYVFDCQFVPKAINVLCGEIVAVGRSRAHFRALYAVNYAGSHLNRRL